MAWASGNSSVIVKSICACILAGVMAASRANAPLVSTMLGLPDGKLTTPISRQKTPCRSPVPSALAQASLAAKTFGIRGGAQFASLRFFLLYLRKNAGDKTRTKTLPMFFQCAEYQSKFITNTNNQNYPPVSFVSLAACMSRRHFHNGGLQSTKNCFANKKMPDI